MTERDPDELREWKRRGRRLKRGWLKIVNRKRKESRYLRDFGLKAAFIRSLPCDTCSAPPPSDPSHFPSRGAGGTSRDLIPQCRRCHDELGRGVETFQRVHGNLPERTAHYEQRWQAEKDATV